MTGDRRDPAGELDHLLDGDPRRRRERELRRYGPRRGPSTWIWWLIALGGLVLFAVLMRAVMEKTRWTAGDADRVDTEGARD
ncbi:hypothetical protein [Lysobacter xanthus]